MNTAENKDRRYPDVVAFVVHSLLDAHANRDDIAPADIAETIAIAKAMFADILNLEREAWLRSDVARLVEDFWDILKKASRGKRDEIIRGALR